MDELDDNYMSSNRTLIAINWNVNWSLILLLGDVEEAGDLVGEAAVHVVDEGIEDFGGGGDGEDIVVGKARRNQGAMAFVKKDFFTGL